MTAWLMSWLVGPGTLVHAADWLALFTHFFGLSLLAVGGAVSTLPDMHRFVVVREGWLSDGQFTASVALAQAAPGPNVLFVAVIGFNVGGLAGVAATLVGTLLPSCALALLATRFSRHGSLTRALRAFTTGMAPLTIGLLLSSCWILLEPTRGVWPVTVPLVALTLWVMLRTRASPLWPLAAGAILGALGWV